jgi:hypothetical protein
MITTFVFDASVPIGFQKIRFLEVVMQGLRKMESRVLMAPENLLEVSSKEKKVLRESGCFEIVSSHDYESEYTELRNEWSGKRINLSRNDKYVLLLARIMEANYVVAQDGTILAKAQKIRKEYELDFMSPMSNADLLRHLCAKKCIDQRLFIKKCLQLYKVDGLSNLLRLVSRDSQWEQRDVHEKLDYIREHFQVYKDPIFEVIHEGVLNE